MRKLLLVFLVCISACGGGYGWVKPDIRDTGPGSSEGRIVGRIQYTLVNEVPDRFRRPNDPISGTTYFLFDSRGYACLVSSENFTMAKDGDLWPCVWRTPRGI